MNIKNSTWSETVKKSIQQILQARAGKGEAVVLDFDNSLLIRNMGDPVSELLLKRGMAQRIAIPQGLATRSYTLENFERLPEHLDLNKFYQQHLIKVSNLPDRDSHIADAYAWAVWCLAGTKLSEIVLTASDIYNNGSAAQDISSSSLSYVPETESLRPFVHDDMISFIADLLNLDYRVFIVSSSMSWIVRWVVQNVVNPGLVKQGCFNTIPPENIFGLSNLLLDNMTLISDRELLMRDSNYRKLDTVRLSKIRLSGQLSYPIPCFEGKAKIIQEYIADRPYLVVGDSRNDVAMFRIAEYRLWLRIVEHTETAIPQLIQSQPEQRHRWLIQEVRAHLRPKYINDPYKISESQVAYNSRLM